MAHQSSITHGPIHYATRFSNGAKLAGGFPSSCHAFSDRLFGVQVDTEIFDVMVKDTGLTKEQLHEWAKTENELKQVCQPEEIAGTVTVT